MTREITPAELQKVKDEATAEMQKKFDGYTADKLAAMKKWGIHEKPVLKYTETGALPVIRVFPFDWEAAAKEKNVADIKEPVGGVAPDENVKRKSKKEEKKA